MSVSMCSDRSARKAADELLGTQQRRTWSHPCGENDFIASNVSIMRQSLLDDDPTDAPDTRGCERSPRE